MKPTKFGSPYLDTPSFRYEFLKFAFEPMKINLENNSKTDGQLGPASQRDSHVSDTEQKRSLTDEELIDDEVADDEVGTNMFPILFHTYRYPRFARRITGASSPTSLVARWQCAVVLQPSPAMAWLGEHGYDIYEP